MRIYLKQIELGPLQNFVYLIGSADTREVAVVDPGWDVPAILKAAAEDGVKITKALVTHTHFDHINGLEEIVRATDAEVFVHKKETQVLPVEPASVRQIEGGQEVDFGPVKLTLLHTPGHTPGSLCVTVADRLIAGDTLFIGGCGRCDLPGGDADLLHKSLSRLSKLDDRMVLYPGHNYAEEPTSDLGKEKARNPFLAAPDIGSFLGLIGHVRRS